MKPCFSAMKAFNSATIPADRLLPGIHGLRGIAAMAIVMYHLVKIADLSVPQAVGFVAGEFSYAVHLFFVLSAFSLMYSTEHTMQRPEWIRAYFIKRFFRIAPLFYLMLAAMVLWRTVEAHDIPYDVSRIILNLTFTFGLAPWAVIVKGGWTVGIEMLFYAIFPLLLLTVRSLRSTALLLTLTVIVSYAARVSLFEHFEHTRGLYRYNWAHFSLLPNLCFFVMGMLAYRMFRAHQADAGSLRLLPGFSLMLLGLLLLTSIERPLGQFYKADLLLWGTAFMFLCLWQSLSPSRWSANKAFEYLGERSYSIYLLHPVLIEVLRAALQSAQQAASPWLGGYAFLASALVLLPLLLLLSEITYRMVEVPGMRHARTLLKCP